MFLKNTRIWPNASLAGRLSAWYAASAFILLLVATGFLYWVLVRSFGQENDQYLAEKLTTLQTLLREHPGQLETVEWEVEGESNARPSLRVLSRVLSPDGRIAVETAGMSQELPQDVFPSPVPPDERPVPHQITRPDGRTFRVLATRVPNGPAGAQESTVQVAVDLTYERDLLAGYRRQLWLVLGAGLIVSIFIGYRIARSGVKPVEEIAATIRRTRSTTLGERVPLLGLPAELRLLAGRFNEMMDRLADSFERMSRFSSDIAHELRTPVNNLLGEIDVALSKARSPDEYRDVLGSLSEEGQQLARLIDSLLFLARAENPATQIQRQEVDVRAELEALQDFYEAPATEAGIELRVESSGSIRSLLDRTLFRRAVGNLLENALAHTVERGCVFMKSSNLEGGLVVSVEDSGIGIAPDHLARIFDRFYRVDPARSKNTGGAGLGLAIVQSIAKLHGGRVDIESEPGRGTRVVLFFPNSEGAGSPTAAHTLPNRVST